MAEIDGMVFMAAGTSPEDAQGRDAELWQEPRDTLDNGKGTNPHYYVWATLPGTTFRETENSRVPKFRPSQYSEDDHNLIEVALREPPEGKGRAYGHVFAGELPYVGGIPNTTATLDSDGSQNQLFIKFERYDAHSREYKGQVTYNAVGDRNKDTNDGGIEDDPQMRAGERNLAYALDRVPMGATDVQVGHVQIDLDTAA